MPLPLSTCGLRRSDALHTKPMPGRSRRTGRSPFGIRTMPTAARNRRWPSRSTSSYPGCSPMGDRRGDRCDLLLALGLRSQTADFRKTRSRYTREGTTALRTAVPEVAFANRIANELPGTGQN